MSVDDPFVPGQMIGRGVCWACVEYNDDWSEKDLVAYCMAGDMCEEHKDCDGIEQITDEAVINHLEGTMFTYTLTIRTDAGLDSYGGLTGDGVVNKLMDLSQDSPVLVESVDLDNMPEED